MLHHIQHVLTQEEVKEFRDALNHDNAQKNWLDGRISVGSQGAQVKRNQQFSPECESSHVLGQRILQSLGKHALFFSAALPLKILPPLFNRYQNNEHYGLHVDGAIMQHVIYQNQNQKNNANNANNANNVQFLRSDLSCTLFLSDPREYEGGELTIHDTYGTHEVKLPAGDLVLYPSSSLHQVMPVTKGVRLCSFFWLQSMIRSDEKRALLFDLDQTIQSLRSRLDSCPETISLTSHYHNLLRQWSEV